MAAAGGGVILLATAALVVAAVVFGLNPLLIFLAVVVVVCGMIAAFFRLLLQRVPGSGLIRSVLGLLSLAAIATILYLFISPAIQGGTATSWIPSWGLHAVAPPKAATTTVEFSVTGTAPIASISFSPRDTNGGLASTHALPFSQTVTTDAIPGTVYSLNASATNVPVASSLTCTITVDGTVVATHTQTGSFAMAFCLGNGADSK